MGSSRTVTSPFSYTAGQPYFSVTTAGTLYVYGRVCLNKTSGTDLTSIKCTLANSAGTAIAGTSFGSTQMNVSGTNSKTTADFAQVLTCALNSSFQIMVTLTGTNSNIPIGEAGLVCFVCAYLL